MEIVGGVRWRGMNATWPLARLTISPAGLSIRPNANKFRGLFRLLGVPSMEVPWARVDRVEKARGFPAMSFGLRFIIEGKRLIWWCNSFETAERMLEEVSAYIPEKVVRRKRRKRVV
jgi:hypothetical protein